MGPSVDETYVFEKEHGWLDMFIRKVYKLLKW